MDFIRNESSESDEFFDRLREKVLPYFESGDGGKIIMERFKYIGGLK